MTNEYNWTDNPTVSGISKYDPDVLNECLMHLKYNNGSLSVGTIFPCVCSASWTPENALPLDGAEYSSSQFPTLWTDYLTGENQKLAVCTYEQYADDIETYAQCAKFAVDTENNKFKVPTIKDGSYITQANTDTEIAKAYNESLPNINATIGTTAYSVSGAFSLKQYESANGATLNNSWTQGLYEFNASNSSSTYQDSAKVQGDNVRLRWFVVVATGTVNSSTMDWSAWATGLSSKVDKDALVTVDSIVEVSDKSLLPSWYRVYSDGWCEQGGVFQTSSTPVNFLKPFKDTNYTVSTSIYHSAYNNWSVGVNKASNSQMYLNTNNTATIAWRAEGFIN